MKRSLLLIALTVSVSSHTLAAVGDMVSGNGSYVADGIVVSGIGTGYLQTSRANSTRLYDSRKGAEWAGSQDSLMCWLHASSNVIQYWQSYYGVFAKPQAGSYYDYDASWNTGFPESSQAKPLPYGRIGTEATSSTDESQEPVPDGRRLAVARDMYLSIPNSSSQPRNSGGVFSWASEWFFRGADQWKKADGSTIDLSAGGMVPDTGGYYANYFGKGDYFQQNLSYTTVYSDIQEKASDVHNTTTGQAFGSTDTAEIKDLLLKGFGVENGVQSESGKIVCLGTTNSYTGNGHVITCYGFTTDNEGNLKSVLVADNNGKIDSYNSRLIELFVKVEEYTDKNGVKNQQIGLYRKANFSSPFISGTEGGVNCITSISFINTPEVLRNMLAEYSDTANEAQVWNGSANEWQAQQGNTEELPTESTGWDVNVNGDNIAAEHRGYYHTYASDGRRVLFDDHAAEGSRSVTITGTVAASSIEVAAAGYTFKAGENAKLQAGADLMIRSMSDLQSEVSLNLHDLTLESGSELSSNQVITVAGEFRAAGVPAAATYALRSSITPVSSVDADLDLTGATAIILEHTINMNGHQLRLHSDTPITLNYDAADSNVPFFANVGQLLVTTTDGTELELAPGSDVTQYLTLYSNGTLLQGGEHHLLHLRRYQPLRSGTNRYSAESAGSGRAGNAPQEEALSPPQQLANNPPDIPSTHIT